MYIQGSRLQEALKSIPISDTKRLVTCLIAFDEQYQDAHQAVRRRVQFLRDLSALAEGGKIAVVNGGRDCDMSEWENSVSLMDANKATVEEWINRFYEYAEGPQWHYLERPSVALKLKRRSRDLALEAFENGRGANAFDVTPEEAR